LDSGQAIIRFCKIIRDGHVGVATSSMVDRVESLVDVVDDAGVESRGWMRGGTG
jgi:hypothetical protein